MRSAIAAQRNCPATNKAVAAASANAAKRCTTVTLASPATLYPETGSIT